MQRCDGIMSEYQVMRVRQNATLRFATLAASRPAFGARLLALPLRCGRFVCSPSVRVLSLLRAAPAGLRVAALVCSFGRGGSPLRPSRPRRPRWGLRGCAGLEERACGPPRPAAAAPPGFWCGYCLAPRASIVAALQGCPSGGLAALAPAATLFLARGLDSLEHLCYYGLAGLDRARLTRSTREGVQGRQRSFHSGEWRLLFLASAAAPYMAFFAHHPGCSGPGSPWRAADFSRLSIPKLSTRFFCSVAGVRFFT